MLYRTIRYAQYIVLWCPVRSFPMPVSAVIGLRTMICPSHKSYPCQSDKRTSTTALTRHQEDPRHKVRRRENPALLSFVLCIQDAPNLKKDIANNFLVTSSASRLVWTASASLLTHLGRYHKTEDIWTCIMIHQDIFPPRSSHSEFNMTSPVRRDKIKVMEHLCLFRSHRVACVMERVYSRRADWSRWTEIC